MIRYLVAAFALVTACGTTAVVPPPTPPDDVSAAPEDVPPPEDLATLSPDVVDAAATRDARVDVPVDRFVPPPPPDVTVDVAPTIDMGPECAPTLWRCGDACVSISSDESHCGGCGRTCAEGQTCFSGSCVATCVAPDTACPTDAGTVCANLMSDSAHCGACGRACPAMMACQMGACAVACPAGQRACDGVCRAIATDRNHCGSCGTVCPTGLSCLEGACALVCPTGQTNCGGRCVDTRTSLEHCGGCERPCAMGGRCEAGICRGAPCGPTDTPTGRCDGNAIARCVGASVEREFCLTGQTCSATPGAAPVCAAPADAFRVSGRITFQTRLVTASGIGPWQMDPAVGVPVTVIDAADRVLAQGLTDTTGGYTLAYGSPANAMVRVRLVLSRTDGPYNFTVRAYEMGTHSFTTAPFAATATATQNMAVTQEASSGAFAIFTVLKRAFEFIQPMITARPAALYVNWQRARATGSTTSSSYFSGTSSSIFLNGSSADPDEFDASVIAHEFGHYFQRWYSRTSNPGGAHDGTPTDPNLAYGEGNATFLGSLFNSSPYYIDAGNTRIRILVNIQSLPNSRSYVGDPELALNQTLGEWLVAGSQYALYLAGADRTVQLRRATNVMTDYLRRTPPRDRGEIGVDLVDYLDGYLCVNAGADRATIMSYVVTSRRFPYDFGYATVCR